MGMNNADQKKDNGEDLREQMMSLIFTMMLNLSLSLGTMMKIC